MLNWLIRNRLAAFEARFDYDLSYARELLAADRAAFLAFARLGKLSAYRKDVPREVYYAAKLTGTVAEDCGPCTQLIVTLALADGVAPRCVAAILEGVLPRMDEPVRLGYQFTRAVLERAAAADELRAEVVRRWGPRGLASLAFAISAARLYPTIKYALGHGQACARIVVDGEPVAPLRPSPVPDAVLRAMS